MLFLLKIGHFKYYSVTGNSPLSLGYWWLVFGCSMSSCCVWAFSSCSEQRLLSSCNMQASYCSGFSPCGAGGQGHAGFSNCGAGTYLPLSFFMEGWLLNSSASPSDGFLVPASVPLARGSSLLTGIFSVFGRQLLGNFFFNWAPLYCLPSLLFNNQGVYGIICFLLCGEEGELSGTADGFPGLHDPLPVASSLLQVCFHYQTSSTLLELPVCGALGEMKWDFQGS